MAFEDALLVLHLDRDDPAAAAMAKRIIELAEHGERNPTRLMLSLPSLRLASAESRLRCSRHAWVTGGNVSLLRLTALRPLLLYASDEVSGLRCL